MAPWFIGKKTDKGYPVINKETSEVKGYSETKAKAKKHLAALYANTKGEVKK
jgi:hypothetical protein